MANCITYRKYPIGSGKITNKIVRWLAETTIGIIELICPECIVYAINESISYIYSTLYNVYYTYE